MDQDSQMLLRLEALIRAEVPGYEKLIKEESGLMKFLNFFAQIFNKDFMTRYITTAYPKVYYPRETIPQTRYVWKILTHEWVHLRNARHRTPVLHGFLYGLPQWLTLLALVSLGAIWGGPWWLLNLCWLLCLAPLPAYFRAREERSAYVTNMATNYWRYGSIMPSTREHLAKQFYESNYYFMWPFKKMVLRWMDEDAQKIIAGEYDNITPYKEIKELIEEIWPESKNLRNPPST
jgi:hypothetical protein